MFFAPERVENNPLAFIMILSEYPGSEKDS
jgi:hypothetical protein